MAVNIYNDHGLGFFLDKMPTFAIGAAHEYRNEDEGWGIPVLAALPGRRQALLAHHREMVADEFDITVCQELPVDHGFTVPMQLFWPGRRQSGHAARVPITANTVQHPIPTLTRCLEFGKAMRTAHSDLSGGHQGA